jgi:hypothetical protein
LKNITTPQLLLSFLFLLLIAGQTGCKDELTAIGTELMPESEFATPKSLDITKALNRLTATNDISPIRTDDAEYGMIGTYNDPVLGTIKADFLVQLTPVDSFPAMRTYTKAIKGRSALQIDSLILKINFNEKDWFKDSLAVHKISIYKLNDLLPNEKYYSNMTVEGLYNPIPLAVVELKAADGYKEILNNSTKAATDTNKYYQWQKDSLWVIQMPDALKNDFENFSVNSTSSCTRAALQNVFKGLYITSELISKDGKSSIIRTSSLTNKSGLQLQLHASYYTKVFVASKNDSVSVRHQLSTSYYPSIDCKRINRFTYTPLSNVKLKDNSTENLVIQGMAGSYACIKIDTAYLYSFKDSLGIANPKYQMSAAALVLKVDTALSKPDEYYPPSALSVSLINSKDMIVESPRFKAGVYSGYIFSNNFTYNDNSDYNLAVYIRNKSEGTYEYQFKINPHYLEALLTYKKYGPNHADFNAQTGRFKGFTDVVKETNAFESIYDLDEIIIKASDSEYNLRRVILKSPQSGTDPLKLNIKYFTYEPTM